MISADSQAPAPAIAAASTRPAGGSAMTVLMIKAIKVPRMSGSPGTSTGPWCSESPA
jgi:hypothetical protein